MVDVEVEDLFINREFGLHDKHLSLKVLSGRVTLAFVDWAVRDDGCEGVSQEHPEPLGRVHGAFELATFDSELRPGDGVVFGVEFQLGFGHLGVDGPGLGGAHVAVVCYQTLNPRQYNVLGWYGPLLSVTVAV